MPLRWITLDVDGEPMKACVATPATPGPGVLVLPEIFGVNGHIQDVCRRLADAGYVALAPDLYHRTDPGLALGYTPEDVARGKALKARVRGIELQVDLAVAAAELSRRAPGPLGVMGFCFGGFCTVVAMAALPLAAGAAFYGAGLPHGTAHVAAPLDDLGSVQGELLLVFGGRDPLIPPADIAATRKALALAGTNHAVAVYDGAGHGFFCDRRPAFNPDAAAQAWARTLALFQRRLR